MKFGPQLGSQKNNENANSEKGDTGGVGYGGDSIDGEGMKVHNFGHGIGHDYSSEKNWWV